MYQIQRSVSQLVLLSLVTLLVLSRLDYGSVTLTGILRNLTNQLQSVLNAAERLLLSGHISPLLCDLRCLRIPQQIKFCLAVLMSRCCNKHRNIWRRMCSEIVCSPSVITTDGHACGLHRPASRSRTQLGVGFWSPPMCLL